VFVIRPDGYLVSPRAASSTDELVRLKATFR